jgi:hypothetical protein
MARQPPPLSYADRTYEQDVLGGFSRAVAGDSLCGASIATAASTVARSVAGTISSVTGGAIDAAAAAAAAVGATSGSGGCAPNSGGARVSGCNMCAIVEGGSVGGEEGAIRGGGVVYPIPLDLRLTTVLFELFLAPTRAFASNRARNPCKGSHSPVQNLAASPVHVPTSISRSAGFIPPVLGGLAVTEAVVVSITQAQLDSNVPLTPLHVYAPAALAFHRLYLWGSAYAFVGVG